MPVLRRQAQQSAGRASLRLRSERMRRGLRRRRRWPIWPRDPDRTERRDERLRPWSSAVEKGHGMNALTRPGTSDTLMGTAGGGGVAPESKDYFVSRDGVRYAGSHLIIDLWDAHRLGDLE